MLAMKLCVLNFSGNVGKSTLSRHVLAPRLPGVCYIPVESSNADESGETDEDAIRGRRFREIMELIITSDSVVADVGASNIEDFIQRMSEFEGSHEHFDLFIVPTIPKKKQIKDTAATISALSELGIAPDKIRLVYNMITPETDLEGEFSSIYRSNKNLFVYEPTVSIGESDLYSSLNGDSIETIVNDQTDFKKEMLRATSKEEKVRLLRLQLRQQQARKVKREHDAAFALLFPPSAASMEAR